MVKLAVGLVVIAAALLGAYALLLFAVRDTHEVRTSHEDVRELTVTAGEGDVELVRARAGAPVEVTERVTEGLSAPDRNNDFTAGRLELSSTCESWLASPCSVDYEIAVPAGTRVTVDSGSGDVRLAGLVTDLPLEATSGSGELEADGVSTPELLLDTGSGDVGAVGLRVGSLTVDVGSGDVALELSRPARRVQVGAGSGDVNLTVPNVTYAVEADGSDGGVSNDGVRVDPRSPRSIAIETGSGEVRMDAG